jgi:hypothetical protein
MKKIMSDRGTSLGPRLEKPKKADYAVAMGRADGLRRRSSRAPERRRDDAFMRESSTTRGIVARYVRTRLTACATRT